MTDVVVYRKRRSAHTPAAKGSKWIRPATRWAIYLRDNFACVYCSHVGGKLSLDHVHAVKGARRNNHPSNLVTCCVSCNSAKQSRSRIDWYAYLAAQGALVATIRRRIARHTKLPIDRVRGRFLAEARRGA